MQHPTSRRSFITAGSLGFLGLSLREALCGRGCSRNLRRTARPRPSFFSGSKAVPATSTPGIPRPTATSSRSRPTSPGIQISELLPKMAKRMDKFALVRSMHTRGTDHPQATHYAITGHEINPAMQFPSLGSIITKEMGPRNAVPAHVLVPKWDRTRQYEEYFRASFLGGDYDPMCIPDPAKPGFEVTDLSLPKSVSQAAVESRSAFLKAVDRRYRALNETAEHTNMDAFTAQAWKMILTPAVRDAFDLSKESDKMKERYGKDSIGQSCLLARRLVEAGSRFVTAAGYHSVLLGHPQRQRQGPSRPSDPAARPHPDRAGGRSGRARPAGIDAGDRDGRIRPHPDHQRQPGPRSLAELLVARAGRRRHQDRPGSRRQRRTRRQRDRARRDDGRPVRHHLPDAGHRLEEGIHEPHRPARSRSPIRSTTRRVRR